MPPRTRARSRTPSRSRSRSRSTTARTTSASKTRAGAAANGRSRSTSRANSRSNSSNGRKQGNGNGNGAATRSQHRNGHSNGSKLTAEQLYHMPVERRFTPERDTWDGHYEFNGPLGAIAIMVASHVLIYYFYMCIELFAGTLVYPGHPLLGGRTFTSTVASFLDAYCRPTTSATLLFLAFLVLEWALAVVLPGVVVKGLPLPSENGYRLSYKCNAVTAWYCMLAILAGLHFSGTYPLQEIRRNYGHFLTAATITADVLAVWVYVTGLKRQIRMTRNLVYDFFIGSALNYRLPGDVDVKLFAECRNSWVLLMILTLSCAAEQYATLGRITGNMAFIVFAQLLYTNAVQKGEECVITTWDIYYEKFGWMLEYWNTCGVPFLYCMQALYIQTVLRSYEYPRWALALMVAALLICYYVWDTVNSQKNRFRMRRNGVPLEIIRRRTFPQMPWRYIENPRTLKSERGELFVDGFYRYARKLHYTVDICMSLLWGCSCGFASFIPFFYTCFFVSHLVDRERRDDHRCKAKYGPLWDKYIAEVPYKFIPYVY